MNPGKIFENQFRKSCPEYLSVTRLPDPPQSFVKSSKTSFSKKNPCDFLCFDSKNRLFLPIELKSTKYKSMSFDDPVLKEDQGKMIAYHQIKGLTEYATFDNVRAGFLLNFRNEDLGEETCYWQNIKDFNEMISKIGKKSFNEVDIMMFNALRVDGVKKRKYYTWDIDYLLTRIAAYSMN